MTVSNFSSKEHTNAYQSRPLRLTSKVRSTILSAGLVTFCIFGFGWLENTSGTQTGLPAANSPLVTVSPQTANNGRVILLEIDTRDIAQPIFGIQAKFGEKRIAIAPHPSKTDGIYFGLIGIPHRTRPGTIAVNLEWTNRFGYSSKTIRFTVETAKYKSERLKVNRRMVNPSPADRQRASRETREVKKVYLISNTSRLWNLPFRLPVDGKVTSPYGAVRLYNRKLKRVHYGVDFRAKAGTPVHAANTGIVRLARNLYFAGKHVIVDHGLGLFTSYSHLSEILVSADQRVEKGQIIGYAGATGRVNGPHLHWGAKVSGTSVDPLQLLEVLGALLPAAAESY
jgi:murein DD-endopeptidase MepM/ murein hydrolase activator NlpD